MVLLLLLLQSQDARCHSSDVEPCRLQACNVAGKTGPRATSGSWSWTTVYIYICILHEHYRRHSGPQKMMTGDSDGRVWL